MGAVLGGFGMLWCGIVIGLLVFFEMTFGAGDVASFGAGLGFA